MKNRFPKDIDLDELLKDENRDDWIAYDPHGCRTMTDKEWEQFKKVLKGEKGEPYYAKEERY